MYSRGGYDKAIQAIQICIRKGNRNVGSSLLPTPWFASLHLHHRYAYFKKLDYFSTECIYSPDAYRGHARVFLKDLESARPSAIIDIIHSGEAFEVREEIKATQKVQRKSSISVKRDSFGLWVPTHSSSYL